MNAGDRKRNRNSHLIRIDENASALLIQGHFRAILNVRGREVDPYGPVWILDFLYIPGMLYELESIQ